MKKVFVKTQTLLKEKSFIKLLAGCLWAMLACVLQSKQMVSLSYHYLKEQSNLVGCLRKKFVSKQA